MSEAYVVVLKIHPHLPGTHSLKGKRALLRPDKTRLRQRMQAAVA